MAAALTSYDEVPYLSGPEYRSHPDRMATVATLLGMTPAALDNCRLLEIGCATSVNLIQLALQFPRSQLLGIDPSARQIAQGETLRQSLGVENVQLRTMSMADLDESFGLFDYVLCHGVYSWVAPAQQDQMLATCRARLAPRGIAYVSYNTYPGWHWRQTLRDLLAQHTRNNHDVSLRMTRARELLRFYLDLNNANEAPLAAHMRARIQTILELPDHYLYHEYLEDDNHPCYFREFVARAQAHGLQYLGETWSQPRIASLSDEARTRLDALEADFIEREQLFDFLCNRPFRQSLLVHASVPLQRPFTIEGVAKLAATTEARPVSAAPELFSDRMETFVADDGARAEVDMPLVKVLLKCLHEARPRAAPFEQLWEQTRRQLQDHGALTPELANGGRTLLAQYLGEAFETDFVSLHVQTFRYAAAAGDKPRGYRLARHVAAAGGLRVPSLTFRLVAMEEFGRLVLTLLDGDHSRSQIADQLVEFALAEKICVLHEDQPVRDRDTLHHMLTETLEEALRRLADACLLEA